MNMQEHLLVKLSEECAEVSQRAAKALRFGLLDVQKDQPFNNAQRIEQELADLIAISGMMAALGMIKEIQPDAIPPRIERITKYLIYSREIGTLKD